VAENIGLRGRYQSRLTAQRRSNDTFVTDDAPRQKRFFPFRRKI